MRQYLSFLVVIPFLACTPSTDVGSPASADSVATWNGAALNLDELEEHLPLQRTPACLEMRRTVGGGGLEEIVACYREVAESLALERLVTDEFDDLDQAIEDLLFEEISRRRAARINLLHRRMNDEIEEASDGDALAHYEANIEDYRRPGGMTLWNIFRRFEDPGDPDATLNLLEEIKARAVSGENFGALAREFSHSETRQRNGLVGRLQEGRLAPKLERIALALGDGDVSEPIRVKGGAVLLQVRGAVEGGQLPFDDVRHMVKAQLRTQRLRETVEARAAAQPLPDGSIVLREDDLLPALDGAGEQPILEIAGDGLTVEGFRLLCGLRPVDRAVELTAEAAEWMFEVYRGQVELRLLDLSVTGSQDPLDVELGREADDQARKGATAELVDRRMREAMDAEVDDADAALRSYFTDNRALFQSPLRFDLAVWHLPFDDDPPLQAARMEQWRASIESGEATLEEAVGSLGGSLADLGRRTLEDLPRDLPAKAQSLLLQTDAGGFSAIFQQDEALHSIWVKTREEPRPLSFEEAEEQVREKYLERFEQQLYTDLVRERLETADFQFHEDIVRTLLGAETESES